MSTQAVELERITSANLVSGFKTTLLHDHQPFAARVSWIQWDSGFRDSGLEIEDLILAVNGIPLALPEDARERQSQAPKVIGQHGEHNGFAEASLVEGASISLTVLRKNRPGRGYRSLEVKGRLRAERMYCDSAGKRALAPGGPQEFARDGTDESWMSWYPKRVWDWERYLDGRWLQGLDNRMEWQAHLQHQARVELALKLYPGEFSRRLKEDFDRVERCLAGEPFALPPEVLGFREANARCEKVVAEAGDRGWEAFLAANQAHVLESLPRLDLIRDDRSGITGKLLVLRGLSARQAVNDGVRAIFTVQHSGHWALLAADHPALKGYAEAVSRYKMKVNARTPESFDVVARIAPQTRMAVTRSGSAIGLDLDPVAVRAPGRFFMDLSTASFAGEELLPTASGALPPDDASPSDVMRVLVRALKDGQDSLWKSLFADWSAGGGGALPFYRPFHPYNTWDGDWRRARNLILNKVRHVEPVWESEPRELMSGREFEGAPHVEEVVVEMSHVDRFEEVDRVFVTVSLRRVWGLQRRNGGPWRIVTRNSI
ncbi:hypothetical protein [Pyxidicoccus xibeiensis]|uniref:hypothetical protein n=1 Tax=Pyxidicoccus xibeiensis TaxID=2906759 RepID=UPI0020A8246D|nr:hypothetical protein [Pyxidicoccus xibeiensis]MCP3136655.1 hypothetical protein [Pyxidicoccus xibeiensis]